MSDAENKALVEQMWGALSAMESRGYQVGGILRGHYRALRCFY